MHWLTETATTQFATTVTCNRDAPQSLKPAGTSVNAMIPGELLTVRKEIGPVVMLQLNVSVALPDPSVAANEMVRGLVVQVTLGLVKLEEGRITEV